MSGFSKDAATYLSGVYGAGGRLYSDTRGIRSARVDYRLRSMPLTSRIPFSLRLLDRIPFSLLCRLT